MNSRATCEAAVTQQSLTDRHRRWEHARRDEQASPVHLERPASRRRLDGDPRAGLASRLNCIMSLPSPTACRCRAASIPVRTGPGLPRRPPTLSDIEGMVKLNDSPATRPSACWSMAADVAAIVALRERSSKSPHRRHLGVPRGGPRFRRPSPLEVVQAPAVRPPCTSRRPSIDLSPSAAAVPVLLELTLLAD